MAQLPNSSADCVTNDLLAYLLSVSSYPWTYQLADYDSYLNLPKVNEQFYLIYMHTHLFVVLLYLPFLLSFRLTENTKMTISTRCAYTGWQEIAVHRKQWPSPLHSLPHDLGASSVALRSKSPCTTGVSAARPWYTSSSETFCTDNLNRKVANLTYLTMKMKHRTSFMMHHTTTNLYPN